MTGPQFVLADPNFTICSKSTCDTGSVVNPTADSSYDP
jgi:hypothetical protein